MPLVKLLGEKLLAAGGKTVSTRDALKSASTVGLYFSAGWCPPCRGFTPQLVSSYQGHLEAKGLRCVLVSWDKSPAEFQDYFGQMPWLALPYEEEERKNMLNQTFNVKSIPTFALVDASSGSVITTEARESLVQDPEGKEFPWTPPLVRDLALGNPGRINEQPSLICLCEAIGDTGHAEVVQALTGVAENTKASGELDLGFFVGSSGSLCEQVRALCGLVPGGGPQLIMLDIPDNGGFYLGPSGHDVLKEDGIRQFLSDFKGGRLERRQLAPPK